MMIRRNRKSQEEIVGFVLIVVVVSIILLVFLGIFARKDKDSSGSPEVAQFLDAVSETTTECSLNNGYNYLDYVDLLNACNDGEPCSDRLACDILKDTTKELIENSWSFGQESPRKGYRYSACFQIDESSTCQDFVSVLKGSGCNSYFGNERSFPAEDGNIIVNLDLCLD